MLQYENVKVVQHYDWNDFIEETFKRPYDVTRQENAFSCGSTVHYLDVPSEYPEDEDMNEDIPKDSRTELRGVKLKKWLETDPNVPILDEKGSFDPPDRIINHVTDFWEYNFYPDLNTLGNYLHEKGLLEAGKYLIEVDV